MGGGAFLNSVPLRGGPAAVTAGFSPGPAAGILIVHNRYTRWSGEIRYLFEERSPRLTATGQSASFSGQSHALHYDVVFNTRVRLERVQPYITLGAGMKVFRGTGAETSYRPLMQYGLLTRANDWKPMVAAGGGVKIRMRERLTARIDFQNHITPFPRKVITPASGITVGNWLFDFVPTFGLSWIF
jgi:hypothetical protein